MSARFARLPLVVVSALLLFALSGFAATARAQAPAPEDKTAAQEHYNSGTSYYDLGKYDDAIREFEAAYELKNDPAFLYNLAQSYRQAGNHERRYTSIKRTCATCPSATNRADIEDKIKTEEQQVAKGPANADHAARHDHAATAGEHDHAAARRRSTRRDGAAAGHAAAVDVSHHPYAPPPLRRPAVRPFRPWTQVPHRRHGQRAASAPS